MNRDAVRESDTTTHCPWKGDASYPGAEVDGSVFGDVKDIRDRVAFYGDKVEVSG